MFYSLHVMSHLFFTTNLLYNYFSLHFTVEQTNRNDFLRLLPNSSLELELKSPDPQSRFLAIILLLDWIEYFAIRPREDSGVS